MKPIYYALLLSGLAITIIRWRQLDRSLHLFAPLYLGILITEAMADWYKAYFLYHINQAFDTVLLFTYYHLLLSGKKTSRWIWVAQGVYLVSFAIYFIRSPNLFFRFDPIDFVVEGVFLTLFSLYYLIELYRSSDEIKFSNHPHFWIATGNLLFYSGASFFMGFAFTLWKGNKILYHQLSYIVQVLNLILYSIYIKGLLCPPVEKKPN
jgi:hypothetical protein